MAVLLRRLVRKLPRRAVHLILYFTFLASLLYFYTSSMAPRYARRRGAEEEEPNPLMAKELPARANPQRGRFDDRRVYSENDFGNDGEDPFVSYRKLPRVDWLDHAAYEADQRRKGVGEKGAAVSLPPDNETLSKLREEIYRQNGYDGYVSDLVALDRSVKDIRHAECANEKYLEKLPSVSVIFPFHNEHFSALLRSVYSIINRSPPEMLREIVLVDDGSTKEALKRPLEEHLREHNLHEMVKIVRTGKREGLIRARQVGAKAAKGEVFVFLDAHSEANYNWLPPLVEPIALNYRTVVCPFVDVVNCDTFEYIAQDEGARGSFDWEFNYKRLPLTKEDLRHPTKPFKNPVMAGGYFAIAAKWFWELGGYDDELLIWGGEQYELSFKVWQCHGTLVDAPCSRVGHIYRCKYIPFPNPGVGDFISRNYKRVAEVWMDEYKHHLYKRREALKLADAGDLTRQLAVRERLKCKSFDWFMREVAFDQDGYYPAVEPPDSANGELRNLAAKGMCVDTKFRGTGERPELRRCLSEDPHEGGEQNLRLSFWEDIRPMARTMCLDVSTSVNKAPVALFACHGMRGNQFFVYRPKSQQLYHKVSNMCMDCDVERGDLFMSRCDESVPTQHWEWSHVNESVIEERVKKREMEEKREAAGQKGL